ncbi:hypothetical protein GOP47_0002970 [Adiantum capillus-veneris]|uniref:Nudix hydrolase domain-containing protein n=1 Tax=Adiantum capillus-veneris TaxID=13818 RepID=A0A9D4ZRT5_ADICA|nr:hypothetical protein GOP47_0002970 [Adiantum capillus-veneris]
MQHLGLSLLHRAGTRTPYGSFVAIKWQQRSYRHFSTTLACCADCRIQDSMPFNVISSQGKFEILKEEVCYSRYLNVYNRVVKLPRIEAEKGKEAADGYTTVDYDIVGSKTVSFHFCTVFPFNTSLKTVTLIKEYAQGANDFVFGVPTGGLSEKHTSLEDCVRKELSEEAHLHEGTVIKLIPKEHPGILEVKWCRNRFSPFLVLDAKKDPAPLSQDPEEIIEVLNVDVANLKDIMYGGSMMLPSIVTCSMALHYLQDHNML